MIGLTPAAHVVRPAVARGLLPDPNMTVDEWADKHMVIPKGSGANESGKYRTDRTPHAREVMRALSDNHWCKIVALMGASQMLKTQVGLNWFCCSVHQSPANFLWILPTGKLQKRTSGRVSKTIAAVEPVRERVASPRSRDSVNTLDTKEYVGGAVHIVTSGAAANLSEIPARRVLYDEVDRSKNNVDNEGDPVAIAKARQTTFERNRKSYFPSSPTITGRSIIEGLFNQGTRREALAHCVHCGHEQPLMFERLQEDEAGRAIYPCAECGAYMYETDKGRMFSRGAWSVGVRGDSETESFTISALFAPYGWVSWKTLLIEYGAARAKLDEGSDELMIVFYNTRLARCWERKKEQTKASELKERAGGHKLGTVPMGGLVLTGAVDTQNDRLELKVVAWGEGMEDWIVDYQVVWGSPAEDATWDKLDILLKGKYRHARGRDLGIAAVFVDSGGAHTNEVYNFTRTRQHRHIYAIKGASTSNKPIIAVKPTLVDVNWMGKVMPHGAKMWLIGTDTAKDYLASRYSRADGPGATHFPEGLPDDYYDQLTAEYSVTVWKRGRKVRVWEKKKNDRNEAGDLMVYNLACAYYLGLHKKTPNQWQLLRENIMPAVPDLFSGHESIEQDQPASGEGGITAAPAASPSAQTKEEPWTPRPKLSQQSQVRRPSGRQW